MEPGMVLPTSKDGADASSVPPTPLPAPPPSAAPDAVVEPPSSHLQAELMTLLAEYSGSEGRMGEGDNDIDDEEGQSDKNKDDEDEGDEDDGGEQEEGGEKASSKQAPRLALLPRFAAVLAKDAGDPPGSASNSGGIPVKVIHSAYRVIINLTMAALDNAAGVDSLRPLLDAVRVCESLLASTTIGPLLDPRHIKAVKERISELQGLAQELQRPGAGTGYDGPPAPTVRASVEEIENFLQVKYAALTPPPEKLHEVERIRAEIEGALKRRFYDCELCVYGSAFSELATPQSDIDFCLSLPRSARETKQCEAALQAAKHELDALTEQMPVVVRKLMEMEEVARKLGKGRSTLQGARERLQRNQADLDSAKAALQQEQQGDGDGGEGGEDTAVTAARRNVAKEGAGKRVLRCQKEVRAAELQVAEVEVHLGKLTRRQAEVREQLNSRPAEDVNKAQEARFRFKEAVRRMEDSKKIVFVIRDVLERHGFWEVTPVYRARVPIVKFLIPPPSQTWEGQQQPQEPGSSECISCDICINNWLAVHNTSLLAAYVRVDWRARAIVLLVKGWAKAQNLNNPHSGSLSSYAYSVMAIYYLQRLGILPNLQDPNLLAGMEVQECEDVNVTFCRNYQGEPGKKAPSASLTELLVGFFYFYGHEFNVTKDCVSIRSASIISKDVWRATKLWRLSIQDPFETHDSIKPHDLGVVLSYRAQLSLIAGCREAVQKLTSGSVEEVSKLFEPKAIDKAGGDGRRRKPRNRGGQDGNVRGGGRGGRGRYGGGGWQERTARGGGRGPPPMGPGPERGARAPPSPFLLAMPPPEHPFSRQPFPYPEQAWRDRGKGGRRGGGGGRFSPRGDGHTAPEPVVVKVVVPPSIAEPRGGRGGEGRGGRGGEEVMKRPRRWKGKGGGGGEGRHGGWRAGGTSRVEERG